MSMRQRKIPATVQDRASFKNPRAQVERTLGFLVASAPTPFGEENVMSKSSTTLPPTLTRPTERDKSVHINKPLHVNKQLTYLVEYQNGRKLKISMAEFNTARGEWVAGAVAKIRQQKGEIPAGPISQIMRVLT
jgi:hypothetical protein